MELTQKQKDYIKEMLFHPKKRIDNPSAFASIFHTQGYEGRRGKLRSLCETEIKKLKSEKGLAL